MSGRVDSHIRSREGHGDMSLFVYVEEISEKILCLCWHIGGGIEGK